MGDEVTDVYSALAEDPLYLARGKRGDDPDKMVCRHVLKLKTSMMNCFFFF